MTRSIISDSLDKLRGATAIVYPMNLPPYDIIRQEFEGIEDLSGTQVCLYLEATVGSNFSNVSSNKKKYGS